MRGLLHYRRCSYGRQRGMQSTQRPQRQQEAITTILRGNRQTPSRNERTAQLREPGVREPRRPAASDAGTAKPRDPGQQGTAGEPEPFLLLLPRNVGVSHQPNSAGSQAVGGRAGTAHGDSPSHQLIQLLSYFNYTTNTQSLEKIQSLGHSEQ